MAGDGFSSAEYSKQWENHWGEGVDVGKLWDAGHSSPALKALLEKNPELCSGKSVAVPGCGRGYDLVSFAQAGAAKVVGVELSPSAVKIAAEYAASQVAPELQEKILVEHDDWLESQSSRTYEVGYDYTFLCALHPNMRPAWAAAWARSIASGGTLIALAFPIADSSREGPPWPLQLSVYEKELEPHGFRCVESTPVDPAQATTPERAGLEILTVWRKI